MNQILFSLETGTVVRRAGDTSFPVDASLIEHKAPRGPVEVTLHDHDLVPADELAELRRIAAEGSSDTIADVLHLIRSWAKAPGPVPGYMLDQVAARLEQAFGVTPRPDQHDDEPAAIATPGLGQDRHDDIVMRTDTFANPYALGPDDIKAALRQQVDEAITLAADALDQAGRPSHGVAILAAAILRQK